jgi:hypothetical protein
LALSYSLSHLLKLSFLLKKKFFLVLQRLKSFLI